MTGFPYSLCSPAPLERPRRNSPRLSSPPGSYVLAEQGTSQGQVLASLTVIDVAADGTIAGTQAMRTLASLSKSRVTGAAAVNGDQTVTLTLTSTAAGADGNEELIRTQTALGGQRHMDCVLLYSTGKISASGTAISGAVSEPSNETSCRGQFGPNSQAA